MTYKFNVNAKGYVEFLTATGGDFVKKKKKKKNIMTLKHAENTAKAGEVKESKIEGYPICVDDTWYFKGEING